MSEPHLVHCVACDAVGAGGAKWYCYRCVEASSLRRRESSSLRDATIAELRAEIGALKLIIEQQDRDGANLCAEVERLHKSYDAQVECTRYARDDWKREHDRAEHAEALLTESITIAREQRDHAERAEADLAEAVAITNRLLALEDVARTVACIVPCIFCGYNGRDFFQRGTHANGCRVRDVGGATERAALLAKVKP